MDIKDWNINIKFKHETDLIEENYNGNHPLQMPIYLFVDFESLLIYVETRNRNIDGILMREHNGLLLSFKLPNEVNAFELKDDIIKYYLEQIDSISEGFNIEYIDSNAKGFFSDEANEKLWEVSVNLENGYNLSLLENGGLWDISNYYECSCPDVEGMTEEQIIKLAKEEIEYTKDNGVIIIGGLDSIYQYLRDFS